MANSTERIGVHKCGIIAERNKWLFREQPVNDIGIDAHMELVEDSGKPKQLLLYRLNQEQVGSKREKMGA